MGSLARGTLSMVARDALYRTLTDSLPLGPARCVRVGATKGACCLCYWLRDAIETETTAHAHSHCPYTQQVLACCWRAYTAAAGSPDDAADAEALTDAEICVTRKAADLGPPPLTHS